MAKSSSTTPRFSKVVISAKRDKECLDVFRGYGVLSRKGVVLEAYLDDFQYALGRLNTINSHLPASRKSRLVRVVAVVEKVGKREVPNKVKR
jgi:hypothetical protein